MLQKFDYLIMAKIENNEATQVRRGKLDTTHLRKAFFSVSSVYFLGLPLTFLAQILLARLFSVEEFGAFGFALSLATVASIPVVAGLPMLLTREVSRYVQVGDVSKYRGLVHRAYLWIVVTSVVLLLSCLIVWHFRFPNNEAESVYQIALVGILVPILSLNSSRSGIMKGLGFPSISEGPTQILQPLFLIAGYLGLNSLGKLTLLSALTWYVIASFLVFLISYVILAIMQPRNIRAFKPDYDDQPLWLRAILPFAAMSMLWTLSAQAAVLLLGVFSNPEAVAAMRVAERGAMLISFPLMFINASIGPHIVSQFRQGDTAQLQNTLRYGARLATVVALPIAGLLVIAGRPLISLTFGEDYSEISYAPMIVLVIGQTISVLIGPAGILLIMTGLEKLNLSILIVALAFSLIITVLLIDRFGAIGAAIGAAGYVILASALAYWAALIKHGLRSSIF